MIPKPPSTRRSAQRTGHGFQISKRRNRAKPAATASSVRTVVVAGTVVGLLLVLAILFALARLPKIVDAEDSSVKGGFSEVLKHRHLALGAVAIFLYVGGEVSIGSFLINFLGVANIASLPAGEAAHYVSYYWGGAMLGRFIGFGAMRSVSPGLTALRSSSVRCHVLIAASAGNRLVRT